MPLQCLVIGLMLSSCLSSTQCGFALLVVLRAVSVDLFVQLPIWLFGSSPSYLAKALSRRAASVSMTFPIVLSRAIGLHAPRSE